MHNHRLALRAAAALASIALVALPAPAFAGADRESGIQLSPESNRYFISKDVGDERWAITYNLDDKTVTGNVFPMSGGAPTFLTCDITDVAQAESPADTEYFLECRAAGPCPSAPCSNQWGEPFAVGPIPGSFLLPADTRATLSGNVQPIFDRSCATSAVCHGNGSDLVILSRGVAWQNTFLVESNGPNGMQGPFIAPFDPAGSFLVQKIEGTGAGDPMPRSSPLDPDKIETIRRWVEEGAADN